MNARTPSKAAAGLALLFIAQAAWSQSGGASAPASAGHAAHPTASAAPAAASDMASGEVRRIDKAAGKLTLRHGEIKSLEMPPMTMVFQVIDATFLDRVKVGDKVRFRADQQGGAYRVIELQLAP